MTASLTVALAGAQRVEDVLDEMGELGELGHLHGARSPLEGMGGPEYLVHGVAVADFPFESENILLERLYLPLRLGEKILEELLVFGIEIVAHRV